MQVWKFEQAVYEREEVRIVIRDASDAKVGKYDYQRCASSSTSVSEWLKQRVYPLTGDREVVVLNGKGEMPHGRTLMSTLRDSYVA